MRVAARAETVRVFFSEKDDRWAESARNWFARTHVFPFVAEVVSSATSEERFDNRWTVGDMKGVGTVTFDTPEWSPAAAAALVLLVLETVQTARTDRAVIVDVARRPCSVLESP